MVNKKPFDVKANKERLEELHSIIVEAGVRKLKVHQDKGDWLDNPNKRNPNYLIAGLIHEVGELQKEIVLDSAVECVIDELGDIFNYLTMILETVIIKDGGEDE